MRTIVGSMVCMPVVCMLVVDFKSTSHGILVRVWENAFTHTGLHTVQTSYGYCMGKCIYPYMITYCSTAHSHVNARYILGSQSNVCAPASIRTPLTYWSMEGARYDIARVLIEVTHTFVWGTIVCNLLWDRVVSEVGWYRIQHMY